MDNKIQYINHELQLLCNEFKKDEVSNAVAYSLMAGGKRIRPLLFLHLIESYNLAYKDYIDIALSIEMIHTYSLIHDDLPCMDNDDLRRGKLTCHKQFNEATALLAGDALLNEAVLLILNSTLDAHTKNKLAITLYKASGMNKMIAGQNMDMQFENKNITISQLEEIHLNKTGALISACLEMAAIIACPNEATIASEIGYKLGLAFQIQDDVLDVTSDTITLGKTVGSDIDNHKNTYVTLLGVEKAKLKALDLFSEIDILISTLSINKTLFKQLIKIIKERVN